MEQVRKGTIGKTFDVSTGYDLTDWLTLSLTFVKPDGETTVVVDDGDGVDDSGTATDGHVLYTDLTGIFDTVGIWSVFVTVTKTGLTLPSAPSAKFQVIDELD
jgi:hypothetical protein